MTENPIAIVLPHREDFGPRAAGAVAMVVRRLVAASDRPVKVIGRRQRTSTFPGIDYVHVDLPGFLPLSHTQSYVLALLPALKRLPPGPIEVHNKPDVALWLARFFPGRPVSLFLHNDPRTMRGARSPASRRRLLRRLAGIATVSGHIRHALLDGMSSPVRAPVIINNALDPKDLPDPRPPHARDQTILFAGRVVADKAPDAFVAACALALPQLPGWRAEIIGADGFSPDGPETDFIRGLRPRAEAANVAMLGYRPHHEVLACMARAAIVAVPSRWQEPFGLTALEAMMCGAAVACSNRGGLAEITGDTALLFDPDDPSGAAQTLIRLATDSAFRAELSTRSLDRARSQFTLDIAAARLEDFRRRLP